MLLSRKKVVTKCPLKLPCAYKHNTEIMFHNVVMLKSTNTKIVKHTLLWSLSTKCTQRNAERWQQLLEQAAQRGVGLHVGFSWIYELSPHSTAQEISMHSSDMVFFAAQRIAFIERRTIWLLDSTDKILLKVRSMKHLLFKSWRKMSWSIQ